MKLLGQNALNLRIRRILIGPNNYVPIICSSVENLFLVLRTPCLSIRYPCINCGKLWLPYKFKLKKTSNPHSRGQRDTSIQYPAGEREIRETNLSKKQ